MSRGVATILGLLCLFGGGLVLWSLFHQQSITDTFNKAIGKSTGTFAAAGNTTSNSNTYDPGNVLAKNKAVPQ